MPIIDYFGMIFEWNDEKFDLVYQSRKITFEEVCSVFFDDYAITFNDNRYYDEQRLITIGMSSQLRVLTVIWVEREDLARIITAFEPSKNQLRRYTNARRD